MTLRPLLSLAESYRPDKTFLRDGSQNEPRDQCRHRSAGDTERHTQADRELCADRRLSLGGTGRLDGSIDWLCWPRFDSESIFAAILDPDSGGHFAIAPTAVSETNRSYRPNSNVLTTSFRTTTGLVELTDLFYAGGIGAAGPSLHPASMLIRQLRGLEGDVQMRLSYGPRPGYGAQPVKFIRAEPRSLLFSIKGGSVHLAANFDFHLDGEGEASFTVSAGQKLDLVLSFNEPDVTVFPPMERIDELIQATDEYWQGWASSIRYSGPHAESVVRSALVLKLLTYSPSGAIIAAPTTSLPERIGASYNWDYRYCWLRDASYTVNAFAGLGLMAEATAFLHWLLHATRLTHPRLKVVYDVFGRSHLREAELPHLEGYRESQPVRIGNAAGDQNQLDVYGEVMNAAAIGRDRGVPLSREERSFLEGIANFVLDHWTEPDDGIWETRDGPKQFVHSKLLCWLALEKAIELCRDGVLGLDPVRLQAVATEIRGQIEARGWNERLQSYTGEFDSEDLDASVLTMPLLGFEPATTARFRATLERVRSQLTQGELVFRHHGDETEGEGAFLFCSFWLVQCLVLQGQLDEAHSIFHALVSRGNDVGLFAEEVDTKSGQFLGNFPQAFTHIGLINAALALQRARTTPASQP